MDQGGERIMDIFSPFIQFLEALGQQTVNTADAILTLFGALVFNILSLFFA
jgi:hypothetical protein